MLGIRRLRRLVVVATAILSGCSAIIGFGDLEIASSGLAEAGVDADAAVVSDGATKSEGDAPRDDASAPADGSCVPVTTAFPTVADTFLDPEFGLDASFGEQGFLQIGAGKVGLFRFDLDDASVAQCVSGACEAALVLVVAPSSLLGKGGWVEVSPVHHDWSEAEATWTRASSARAWAAPGAGGSDLGSLLTSAEIVTVDAGATLRLSLVGMAETKEWLDDRMLSFRVWGSSGFYALVLARESPPNAARLEITYCRP